MTMKSIVASLTALILCNGSCVRGFTSQPSFSSRRLSLPSVSVAEAHIENRRLNSNNNRRQQRHVLFMGWGPDPIWSPASVVSNVVASESGVYAYVTVQVSPEAAAEYKIPGQYVQLRKDSSMEKPLFMAIASPPSTENAAFEFLVKKTEGNGWLTDITSGTPLEISQVMGPGYAITENLDGFKYDFPTQNIVLCAAGSGIAPIKAAMESGALQVGGDAAAAVSRTCRLYYGERCAGDLALVDRFAAWEAAGIEVVPVLSQPAESDDWQGRTGYVQTALEEDGIAVPRNSAALLCGPKGMTEAVKQLLVDSGMFEGRVLFNF